MDADVQDLVLSSFQDVVAKGRTALENATSASAPRMQKAAQGLVSNGERALKKIEPLCKRQVEEYGGSFVDALKENDEISSFREQLSEVLWDLDDCIEVEGFDAEVYSRLQTLLRTAALRTADIIVRMKLEKPSPVVAVQPVPEESDVMEVPPEPTTNPWGSIKSLPDDVSTPEIINGVVRRPRVPTDNVPASIEAWEDAMASWSSPRIGSETPVDPKLAFQQDRRSQASSASLKASSVDSRSLTSQRFSQASSLASSLPDRRGRESLISPATDKASLSRPTSPWTSPIQRPAAISRPFPEATPTTPSIPEQPDLEVNPPAFDDGLIPVAPQISHAGLEVAHYHPSTRTPSFAIDQKSSFHLLKGFCPGATASLSGSLGLKKTKQPSTVLGAGVRTSAKCTHCMFELSWSLVEADLQRRPSANYKTSGVGFRLRFLSKSHLPAKRVDDQLYACLFCVGAGRTKGETDATVWFTQKGLFEHLARHERPLPRVEGLVVIEGDEMPESRKDDYDLRFFEPPRPRGGDGVGDGMPMVRATESFKATNGALRSPPDRAVALQFAVGAKIGGVEFPAKYNGEWAVGWADGVRAAFPVDCVRLELPWEEGVVDSMQVQSTVSGQRAAARWKHNPPREGKDGGPWLRFEKGEVIVGISFPHEDHWCWSGRNAKGKWGLFPSAFIEPGSLAEGGGLASSAGSIRSQERVGGMFSRLTNRRKKESWRSSSGSSSISGETTLLRPSGPSVY
ncbi:hypothetical protein B0T16DRAFT_184666 [Cercophora newfieldiana]|uniref:SH3 domain-containing protein n=1 Tax=Cercophora newfieldiana TaxID=92897 RepID=A0AA39Y2X2_9PEZI|nr:hypothetical protein B0T16DRAFT_184666 [Cercophora newfieldiana]